MISFCALATCSMPASFATGAAISAFGASYGL